MTKEQALEAARARKVERTNATVSALYTNDSYVDLLVAREDKDSNLKTMQTMMHSLQAIPAERLADQGEIKVRAYALGVRQFGQELGHLIGLVSALDSVFLDTQKEFAFAICNTNEIELEDITAAFGRTAYYSKNNHNVEAEVAGNYELAKSVLITFASSLGLKALDMSKFTKSAYESYFKLAQLKAERKHAAVARVDATTADDEGTTLVIKDA